MPIANDDGYYETELDAAVTSLPQDFQVEWSKLNQPLGEIKGTGKEDTPVVATTASPLVTIREGDIGEAMNVAMGAGPASIVGTKAILPREAVVNLGKARSMTGFKDSPDEILNKTGWYKGPDAQWRYEISDEGMKLVDRDWKVGEQGKLKDFVEHPELYKAYPELADYKFAVAPKNYQSIASVNPRTKTIMINPSKIASGDEGILDVLAHEIQHTIQLKEGFALGGSPVQALAQATTALVEKMKVTKDPEAKREMMDLFLSIHGKADDFGHYMYMRLPGEVEANSVAARRQLTDAQRKQFPVKEMEKMMEGEDFPLAGAKYVTDFIYPE